MDVSGIIPYYLRNFFALQQCNLSDVFILPYRNMVLFIKMSQQDATLGIMELHSFSDPFFIIIAIAVPTAVRTTVIITDINRRHAAAGRTQFAMTMRGTNRNIRHVKKQTYQNFDDWPACTS